MSGKGLEHVEPPTYELDQSRLGRFEVGLSWSCDRRPAARLARVFTWPESPSARSGWLGSSRARATAGRGLTLREVSKGIEIARAGVPTTMPGVRAYGWGELRAIRRRRWARSRQ